MKIRKLIQLGKIDGRTKVPNEAFRDTSERFTLFYMVSRCRYLINKGVVKSFDEYRDQFVHNGSPLHDRDWKIVERYYEYRYPEVFQAWSPDFLSHGASVLVRAKDKVQARSLARKWAGKNAKFAIEVYRPGICKHTPKELKRKGLWPKMGEIVDLHKLRK